MDTQLKERLPEAPLYPPYNGGGYASRRPRHQFTLLAIVALCVAFLLLATTIFLFVAKNSVSADLDASRAVVAAQQEQIGRMKVTISDLEAENAALVDENAGLSGQVTVALNSWEAAADWFDIGNASQWGSIAHRINRMLNELFDGNPPVRFTALYGEPT